MATPSGRRDSILACGCITADRVLRAGNCASRVRRGVTRRDSFPSGLIVESATGGRYELMPEQVAGQMSKSSANAITREALYVRVVMAADPRMIASAFTGFPFVPGLQASIVPSNERVRGATRSMCDTPPSPRGAVVLALGVDAPRLVLRDGPVAGRRHPRAAGEARTDGVQQRLTERFHAGRVHPDLPDALDGGVVGGEGGGALGTDLGAGGQADGGGEGGEDSRAPGGEDMGGDEWGLGERGSHTTQPSSGERERRGLTIRASTVRFRPNR